MVAGFKTFQIVLVQHEIADSKRNYGFCTRKITENMKYLVIGSGGTGGLIGAYLAKNKYDVTMLARGSHLKAIKEKGLTIHPYEKLPYTVAGIRAVSQEDLHDTIFDFIFICVKAYSLTEIVPLLQRTSDSHTTIIPILNSMETGNKLRTLLPNPAICDGCIYIAGYISAPGEIIQGADIFKIVYGFPDEQAEKNPVLKIMEKQLNACGIDISYSRDIRSKIFKKMTFTSAFAAVGAYFNVEAKKLQQDGKYRKLFIALLTELTQIAKAANFKIEGDIIQDNLDILSNVSPDFTTSLQKDLKAGKPDEREQLIFEIIHLAEKYNVRIPNYLKIAEYFGYK